MLGAACRAALVLLVVGSAGPVSAQFMVDHDQSGQRVRGLHGPLAPAIRRSFDSDREATTVFRDILAATGIPGVAERIQVRASADTPNAAAQIGEQGQRYIFFNSTFMRRIAERSGLYWSQVFVIAHEVGHHIAGHLDFDGQNHRVELEADRYGGFILGRMGASHDDAVAAVTAVGGAPTETHPAVADRIQIVSLGWKDGAGPARPLAPPVAAAPVSPPSAPPASAAPPPAQSPGTRARFSFRVNTRLVGRVMTTAPQPNPDACRKTCEATPGCIGYQHGRVPPLTSVCQLLDEVSGRITDTNWRSGIRAELAAAVPVRASEKPALAAGRAARPSDPIVAAPADTALGHGFHARSDARIVGGVIKTGVAESAASCLTICRHTAGCIGATFAKPGSGPGFCTAHSSADQIAADRLGRMAIFKSQSQ